MKKLFYILLLAVGGYVVFLVMRSKNKLPLDASLIKKNEESMKDYGSCLPDQSVDAIVIHRWGRAMTMWQYNRIKFKLSLLDDIKYTFGVSMTDAEFKKYLED